MPFPVVGKWSCPGPGEGGPAEGGMPYPILFQPAYYQTSNSIITHGKQLSTQTLKAALISTKN